LLAIIGASGVVYSNCIGAGGEVYYDFRLIAGIISLAAILVSFPIGVKCYFYYELLETALLVGLEVEKLIFKDAGNGSEDTFGLTHRLYKISTKKFLSITFFGWTIFLPFIILAEVSLGLAVFYFDLIKTFTVGILTTFGLIGLGVILVLIIGYLAKP